MLKKQLKRGIDWHAWAWEARGFERTNDRVLMHFAEPVRRSKGNNPTEKGKWVRVKFKVVR